jgi:hypothetical protein
VDWLTESSDLEKVGYFRSVKYLRQIRLQPERWGERPVAPDVHGTLLEHVRLKRKAYWKAVLILDNQEQLNFKPDGKELLDLRWFRFPQARVFIKETNHPEKAQLLLDALRECEEHDLRGVPFRTAL